LEFVGSAEVGLAIGQPELTEDALHAFLHGAFVRNPS
jgi:hypothetical protein